MTLEYCGARYPNGCTPTWMNRAQSLRVPPRRRPGPSIEAAASGGPTPRGRRSWAPAFAGVGRVGRAGL